MGQENTDDKLDRLELQISDFLDIPESEQLERVEQALRSIFDPKK